MGKADDSDCLFYLIYLKHNYNFFFSYFQELLQSPKFIAANVNEVILLKDGSWSLEKTEPQVQKKTTKTNVEVICDDVGRFSKVTAT